LYRFKTNSAAACFFNVVPPSTINSQPQPTVSGQIPHSEKALPALELSQKGASFCRKEHA
jgi:hypothetical protein